jgi:hypothetical protein
MNDKKSRVLDLIEGQQRKFELILQSARTLKQVDLDIERYVQWREQTTGLIKDYLGEHEAKRFYSVDFKPDDVLKQYEVSVARIDLSKSQYDIYFTLLKEGIMDDTIDIHPAALQSKRYLVLKKLWQLAPHDKHGEVFVDALAKALGMEYQEANRILLYWERKGLVESPSDQTVALTPFAIDEIEESVIHPEKGTEHFPSTVINYHNTVNIAGNNVGQAIAGNHSTQHMQTLTSVEIVSKLAALIEAVKSLNFPEQHEVIDDLDKIRNLSSAEQSEGVIKRIQTRLAAVKTTMEVAGLAYQSLPHWTEIWSYFHRLF